MTIARFLGLLLLWVPGACAASAGPTTTTEAAPATTATSSTTTSTTTSTTAPPKLTTSDLPTADGPDGDIEAIKVLQRLLTATCCTRVDDGDWGPKTAESLLELRSTLNLGDGGLDTELWEAVLSRAPAWNDEVTSGVVGGVPLPTNAVLLDQPSQDAAHYVIAGATDRRDTYAWFSRVSRGQDFSQWLWCSVDLGAVDGNTTALRWWKGTEGATGPVLLLLISDLGAGRVDLHLTESQGASVTKCNGYQKPGTSSSSEPASTTKAPKATRSLSDLVPTFERYRWDDDGLGWKWRPIGTYVNRSESRIIYSEVIWYIEDIETGTRIKYWESVEAEIPAGGAIDIMRGLWFPLSINNLDQTLIGLYLGSSALSVYPEVRYIMYEDYTTVGVPV